MERYRYLTKVRCYLANGEYIKAQALLEKLRYYAEQTNRPYIQMETGLLSAITKERAGGPWQEELAAVLKEAEHAYLRYDQGELTLAKYRELCAKLNQASVDYRENICGSIAMVDNKRTAPSIASRGQIRDLRSLINILRTLQHGQDHPKEICSAV